MRLIAWTSSELQARSFSELLPEAEVTRATSLQEFIEAKRDASTVSILDMTTLRELREPAPGHVIAIADDNIQTAITWFAARSWLSHVMSASALQHPLAAEHLSNVVHTLIGKGTPRLLDWVEPTVVGRRVRLSQASKRADRLERMTDFYTSHSVSPRTIQVLRDAAEELLTNAFYDAPVAAGVVAEPISRTRDVCLLDDGACDMVYGCRDDLAIVRVRDPFGSLQRSRLMDVLVRCARSDMQVQVDETMGGAGLGLWRIFSGASVVAISVLGNRHTEILVGMWKRAAPATRPFAFHLFFNTRERGNKWRLDKDTTSTAVTLVNEQEI